MDQMTREDRPVGPPVPGWAPPPRPPRRAMQGHYVRLEPLDAHDHAGTLHHAFGADPGVWDYMPYGPFASAAAYHRWVKDHERSDDPVFFAACDLADGAPAGVLSYLRIAPGDGTIELGHICLAPRLQRSRAATEAMVLMIGWAFEAGYRRFEWKCDALNRPSRRAAVRLGLSFEGVFRQATVVKGRNRDTAWFAAIDAEWPALRDAYRAWLEPGNFDAEGRQIMALSELTRDILVRADPDLAGPAF